MKPLKKTKRNKRGRPNKPWTEEEINYLYEHRNDPLEPQAKALGRCRVSVCNKRYELGIRHDTIWSAEKVAELKRLYRTGLRATAISKALGISYSTAANKITALRYAKKL